MFPFRGSVPGVRFVIVVLHPVRNDRESNATAIYLDIMLAKRMKLAFLVNPNLKPSFHPSRDFRDC